MSNTKYGRKSTVLVTGASRGIGYEFARQYADAGYSVIACCRKLASKDKLALLEAEHPAKIEKFSLDVCVGSEIDRLKKELEGRAIDILINNAGIWGGDRQTIDCIDYDAWFAAFAVNTIGPFRMIQALRENLARSSERKLVFVTSEMGSIELGGSGSYIYRSTKAAANRVLRSAAEDLRGDGVLALAIHPGWVRTDMGTQHATYSPEQSVSAMRQVIASLHSEMSGSFVSLDGKCLPW